MACRRIIVKTMVEIIRYTLTACPSFIAARRAPLRSGVKDDSKGVHVERTRKTPVQNVPGKHRLVVITNKPSPENAIANYADSRQRERICTH